MLEMTTIPEEWLAELSEEDRARIIAQADQPLYDPYEDRRDDE
jgi:hypothetical protein